jgi:hypothetical protein
MEMTALEADAVRVAVKPTAVRVAAKPTTVRVAMESTAARMTAASQSRIARNRREQKYCQYQQNAERLHNPTLGTG